MKNIHIFLLSFVTLFLGQKSLANPINRSIIQITEQTKEDKNLKKELKPLFFEQGKSDNSILTFRERAIINYQAREITIKTEDNFELSGFFFERENASVNIIFLTGYFHNETPPKEWCAPFAKLFPNYNLLMFDWRGFGQSQGSNKMFSKNDFGPNAYLDAQAAIDFIKTKNDNPIILHGFCFGAAMALHTTIKALEENKTIADALVLSSIFTEFENLFSQAYLHTDSKFCEYLYYLGFKTGLDKLILNYMMNGKIFDIKPIEMIEKINIPCLFDHSTQDLLSPIKGGKTVFEKSQNEKNIFLESKFGKHVRIHTAIPDQYCQVYGQFLKNCGFLDYKQ